MKWLIKVFGVLTLLTICCCILNPEFTFGGCVRYALNNVENNDWLDIIRKLQISNNTDSANLGFNLTFGVVGTFLQQSKLLSGIYNFLCTIYDTAILFAVYMGKVIAFVVGILQFIIY